MSFMVVDSRRVVQASQRSLRRLDRSWIDSSPHLLPGCQCGMKGASLVPRKHRPARYSSETATGVPHPFLSHLPAPTAWANLGPRLSNHRTQGQSTRTITVRSLTPWPQPASLKPPLRASRRSFRKSDARRFRKPGARACRCGQSSGTWESTEAL